MSGRGDIQVSPTHLDERATAWRQLRSRDMTAAFELLVPPMTTRLEYTYQLVPRLSGDGRAGRGTVTAGPLRGPGAASD